MTSLFYLCVILAKISSRDTRDGSISYIQIRCDIDVTDICQISRHEYDIDILQGLSTPNSAMIFVFSCIVLVRNFMLEYHLKLKFKA